MLHGMAFYDMMKYISIVASDFNRLLPSVLTDLYHATIISTDYLSINSVRTVHFSAWLRIMFQQWTSEAFSLVFIRYGSSVGIGHYSCDSISTVFIALTQ